MGVFAPTPSQPLHPNFFKRWVLADNPPSIIMRCLAVLLFMELILGAPAIIALSVTGFGALIFGIILAAMFWSEKKHNDSFKIALGLLVFGAATATLVGAFFSDHFSSALAQIT